MSTVRTIAKNVVSLSAMQVAIKLLAFAIFLLIVNRLNNAAYGMYAVLIAYCGIWAIFCDLGVTTYYAREYARNPELVPSTIFNLLVMRLAASALVFAAAAVGMTFIDKGPEAYATFLWIMSSYVVISIYNIFRTPFDAGQRMEHNAVIETVHQTLVFLFSYLALRWGGGIVELGIAHFASSFVCLILWVTDYLHVFKRPQFIVSMHEWPEIPLRGFPFLTFSIIAVVQSQVAVLLVGLLAGDDAAGYFSKAFRVIFVIYTVPQVAIASMFPVLSRMAVQPTRNFNFASEKLSHYLLAVGLPVCMGCWMLAKPFCNLLFGADEPKVVVWSFRILALTLPFVFSAAPGNVILNAKNRERLCMALTSVAAAVLFVAAFVMIPLWGEYGASLASLMSNAVLWGLFAYQDKKLAGVSFFTRKTASAIASTALMGLVIYFTRNSLHLFLNVALGAAIYAVGMLATRFFDSSDREIIQRLFNRT